MNEFTVEGKIGYAGKAKQDVVIAKMFAYDALQARVEFFNRYMFLTPVNSITISSIRLDKLADL